jgi:hypothetical protein
VQVAHTLINKSRDPGLFCGLEADIKMVCAEVLSAQTVIQLNGGHFQLSDLHSEKWKTALDHQLAILLVRKPKKCAVGTGGRKVDYVWPIVGEQERNKKRRRISALSAGGYNN